ncbi:Digestive organ expansion factor family protein [Entamoeba marina]
MKRHNHFSAKKSQRKLSTHSNKSNSSSKSNQKHSSYVNPNKVIQEEIDDIKSVGKIDFDQQEDDIFDDVVIEEESNISELPTDVNEDCSSSKFLQRPLEVALIKNKVTITKDDHYQIHSNFDLPETNNFNNIPQCFLREYEDFLKVNEIPVDNQAKSILSAMREYSDVFVIRHFNDMQFALYRLMSTLHIATHLREIRTLRLKHTFEASEDPPQDSGFVKPTVLALFPFKTAATVFIKTLLTLYGREFQENIRNEERFAQEFPDIPLSTHSKKPNEFYQIFEGNSDDCFKLGVKFGKNGVQLYSNYYESDLIIASPLGIKILLAKSTNNEVADIFSSLKIIMVESVDVVEMQNISHLMELLQVSNKVPSKPHGTDIRRVYMHEVEGKSEYYRQTIVYSRYRTPYLNSIIRNCVNSKVYQITETTTTGSLLNVVRTLPISFYSYNVTTPLKTPDERFDYFTKQFLAGFVDGLKQQVLLYIPSYFDYLRIKQYFSNENINCLCIFHFYHRFRLGGIKHIIFYELPNPTHYVSEFINMISGKITDATVHVLFNRLDAQKLRGVVGDERAAYLMTSQQNKHTFV